MRRLSLNRKKTEAYLSVLSGLMDANDNDVFIADKNCKLLLANSMAQGHLAEPAPMSCNGSYSALFPGLCASCPNNKSKMQDATPDIELADRGGTYYAIRYRPVRWIDGSQCIAIFARNINIERTIQERLYNLAYIDQLTGVANRRKLKEDMDSIEERIAKGEVTGALAIFDLDFFKTINDNYGHNIGDIMLKRLTGRLESDEAFRGHLYRLGGDEFVFLYADRNGRFGSLTECQAYYENLFNDTLHSYTLPNIDAHCTISMGVCFFPWQGQSYSDILRKADIALYKAKGLGRNRICLFDEAYDTARKLKDIYINVQPILDENGKTFAYELADQTVRDEAHDETLDLNDIDRTMEAIGFDDFESSTKYVINYTSQLLNHAVAKHLPSGKFIIGIKLNYEQSVGDLKKYAELCSLGYSLRLTGVNRRNALPELLALAEYCSFDTMETDESFKRSIFSTYKSIRFIATNVGSPAQFENAKKLGYTLFQGFYFKEPIVVKKTKEIDQLKINYLRLLKLTSTEGHVDFHEIASIISTDVALTYKLLRLLNSAAVGLRNPISSISLAVSYLGEVNLKKWIAMLAVRGVADDKPLELIRVSLIRAHFGELLCNHMKPARNAKHVFLTGLLSLLDVALEKSKDEVFNEISVSIEIQSSILTEEGPYSDIIKFFSDYECGRWDEVSLFIYKNNLTDDTVNNAYLAATKWFSDMLNEIG